jgi:hypothetical protein
VPLYSTACPLPINRKISRRRGSTPAPSGISLTAPTIYASGLTFQDQDPFYSGSLNNPYFLIESGQWLDSSGIGNVYYQIGIGWTFYSYAIFGTEDPSPTPALVATNTALATSLPTTGWTNTNQNLIVSGTLVISTTP